MDATDGPEWNLQRDIWTQAFCGLCKHACTHFIRESKANRRPAIQASLHRRATVQHHRLRCPTTRTEHRRHLPCASNRIHSIALATAHRPRHATLACNQQASKMLDSGSQDCSVTNSGQHRRQKKARRLGSRCCPPAGCWLQALVSSQAAALQLRGALHMRLGDPLRSSWKAIAMVQGADTPRVAHAVHKACKMILVLNVTKNTDTDISSE